VVKFCQRGQERVSPVSDVDVGIYQLQRTKKAAAGASAEAGGGGPEGQRRSKGAAEGRQEGAGAEVSARLQTGGEEGGEPAGQAGVHQWDPGPNRSVAERQDGGAGVSGRRGGAQALPEGRDGGRSREPGGSNPGGDLSRPSACASLWDLTFFCGSCQLCDTQEGVTQTLSGGVAGAEGDLDELEEELKLLLD
ncbi:unnamed protein product, partial [Tetraodon nigroviridis]